MSSIIVACSRNRTIGSKNDLPWYLPADLRHFKDLTSGNTVVMGANTFKSIYNRLKGPLPNRLNIVVSTSLTDLPGGFEQVKSLDELKQKVNISDPNVFIIGGAQLYQAVLDADMVDKIYLTEIEAEIDGDVFFPELPSSWRAVSQDKHTKDQKNPYDYNFIELVRK